MSAGPPSMNNKTHTVALLRCELQRYLRATSELIKVPRPARAGRFSQVWVTQHAFSHLAVKWSEQYQKQIHENVQKPPPKKRPGLS